MTNAELSDPEERKRHTPQRPFDQPIGASQTQVVAKAQEGRLDDAMSIKRRLAAVAFADVAGFSRLIAANDVETLRKWRVMRKEIMDPHMVRNGGRVAEMAGDAVLVEFASAVNAVRWAATSNGGKARKDGAVRAATPDRHQRRGRDR
jgi:class 3 adenylate cyclase